MDVREKFVELLADLSCNSEYCEDCEFAKNIDGCVRRQKEIIADHLIANGVTVQEWVPVSERLPEIPEGWAGSPDYVLYMMKNTKTIYAGYYGEGGVWRDKYFRQYADSRNGVDVDDVICWMYQHDLPQPPKGE